MNFLLVLVIILDVLSDILFVLELEEAITEGFEFWDLEDYELDMSCGVEDETLNNLKLTLDRAVSDQERLENLLNLYTNKTEN